MIKDEKLNKLYECVINDEITTKNLKSYGLNSNDITNLVKLEILERVERGVYKLLDVDGLYTYSVELYNNQEYIRASLGFEKCIEMDEESYNAYFYLINHNLAIRNYEEAFKYIKMLIESDNEFLISDGNTYLYLLSKVYDVGDEYREYARELQYSQMKISFDDFRFSDHYEHNQIRGSVSNDKYSNAIKRLHDLKEKTDYGYLYNRPIKTLLCNVIEYINEEKEELLELVKNEKHEEIISYLEDKDKRSELSHSYYTILDLCNIILEIDKTNKFPEIRILETDKFYEAIEGNNFKLAKRLSEEYMKKYNIFPSNDLMYNMISKLCEKIEQVINKEKNIDFNDVMNCLLKNDVDNAYKNLSIYLKSIGKSEYEFLIVDLIKLGALEQDLSYSKACGVLTFLGMGMFNFDINNYINYFYMALNVKRFKEARIYLDIISKANNIIDNKIVVETLVEALNTTESLSVSKALNKEIDEKVKYLRENKGLVIFEPMIKEERNKIYEHVKDYEDIAMFSVGIEPDKRTILKHREPYMEKDELNNEFNLGKKAFEKKKYEEAIEHFLNIINRGKFSAYVSATLGLAYLKIDNKEEALKYLIVANCMNKESRNGYSLDDIIAKLQGKKMARETTKDYFKMDIEEFKEEDFSVIKFNEINSYVMTSGLDVREACKNLDMSEEEINKVLLTYAKEYYTCGIYEKGDQFLKAFEKSENKSHGNMKLYNEIVKNKKFYFNRTKKKKEMSLVLKP